MISPDTIKPEDYLSEDRIQELITCADRRMCATAVRQAIREAVASVLSKMQQPLEAVCHGHDGEDY